MADLARLTAGDGEDVEAGEVVCLDEPENGG
jgi:hypothetical protein